MRPDVRGYAAALGALAAGGLLCLAASAVSWGEARTAGPAGTSVSVTGSELLPAIQGVGLLALAAVLAVHATRRWGRRVVAGLLVAAGLATAALASRIALELSSRVLQHATAPSGAAELSGASSNPAGVLLAVAGGLLVAAAGLAVLVRGSRWPSMGGRYVRAAPGRDSGTSGGRSAWEALDRGEDPTA